MMPQFSDLEHLPWTDDLHIQQQKEHMSSTITQELLLRKNRNTPDFFELKARGENLVLVYGTLRVGNPNYYLLEGSKFLGKATTTTDGFVMRRGRQFPAVKRDTSSMAGKILGEVFSVDAVTMCELDRLEGNTQFYTREEVFVTLHDQEIKLSSGKIGRPTVKAWMYMLPKEDTSFDSCWLANSKKTVLHSGKESRIFEWTQPTWNSINGLDS